MPYLNDCYRIQVIPALRVRFLGNTLKAVLGTLGKDHGRFTYGEAPVLTRSVYASVAVALFLSAVAPSPVIAGKCHFCWYAQDGCRTYDLGDRCDRVCAGGPCFWVCSGSTTWSWDRCDTNEDCPPG